jgi:hypothetical protein
MLDHFGDSEIYGVGKDGCRNRREVDRRKLGGFAECDAEEGKGWL